MTWLVQLVRSILRRGILNVICNLLYMIGFFIFSETPTYHLGQYWHTMHSYCGICRKMVDEDFKCYQKTTYCSSCLCVKCKKPIRDEVTFMIWVLLSPLILTGYGNRQWKLSSSVFVLLSLSSSKTWYVGDKWELCMQVLLTALLYYDQLKF